MNCGTASSRRWRVSIGLFAALARALSLRARSSRRGWLGRIDDEADLVAAGSLRLVHGGGREREEFVQHRVRWMRDKQA
jgi:hypothetical protein